LVHFSILALAIQPGVSLVVIILMIFLVMNGPNFVYLLVGPGFLPPPLQIFMKHRGSLPP